MYSIVMVVPVSELREIHTSVEPYTADRVYDIVRGNGEGLYYVKAPHWLFPLVVWDEDVVALVSNRCNRSDVIQGIQDDLNYQQ